MAKSIYPQLCQGMTLIRLKGDENFEQFKTRLCVTMKRREYCDKQTWQKYVSPWRNKVKNKTPTNITDTTYSVTWA